MKMIKTFSREELYEEIWEISAKQVSLKYDLSYSDLLKKCKEFEIPIPNGSYTCQMQSTSYHMMEQRKCYW